VDHSLIINLILGSQLGSNHKPCSAMSEILHILTQYWGLLALFLHWNHRKEDYMCLHRFYPFIVAES